MGDDYGRGLYGGAPENHSQQYYAGVQARNFQQQQRQKMAEDSAANQSKRTYGSTSGEHSASNIFGGIVAVGVVILLIAIFG